MARLEVNRSGEMEVFVQVVRLGGFSPAARAFHMTPSAVSKLVARLEARLGARLAAFTVREDVAAGRLVPVLEHLNPGDREDFHAVFLGQGGPLPARIRALLDFLAEEGRVR